MTSTIPANADAPAASRDLIRLVGAGCPAHVVDRAELAISELVTNAVRHGSDATASIEVTVSGAVDGLVATVSDGGRSRATHEDDGGGFGLDIVRQVADEISIETGPGWTVRVVFRSDRRQMT